MSNKHFKFILFNFLLLFSLFAHAASLDLIQRENEIKLAEAQVSQQKIDKIVAGAQQRLIQYRALLKQIEGLKVYNEQLSTQVKSQQNLLLRFDQSIEQVALIERQMTPLVLRMADSLDQFVELDMPFHSAERQERIALIQESMQAANADVADRFRQVIEAYQIENEYGRKIDTYQDIIRLNGREYEVDILRVGRIAMLFQTRDTRISGHWNNAAKDWQVLDNATYRNSIRQGIRMASKQASIGILTLPIRAPGAVQ